MIVSDDFFIFTQFCNKKKKEEKRREKERGEIILQSILIIQKNQYCF